MASGQMKSAVDRADTLAPIDTAQVSRLLALPPELRAMVWHFAFTFSAKSNKADTSIIAPHRPTSALPLTCRQIYIEAVDLYNTIRIPYRSNGNFMLDGAQRDFHRPLTHIQSLCDADLKHVKKLTIQGSRGRFIYDDGVWCCWVPMRQGLSAPWIFTDDGLAEDPDPGVKGLGLNRRELICAVAGYRNAMFGANAMFRLERDGHAE